MQKFHILYLQLCFQPNAWYTDILNKYTKKVQQITFAKIVFQNQMSNDLNLKKAP